MKQPPDQKDKPIKQAPAKGNHRPSEENPRNPQEDFPGQK